MQINGITRIKPKGICHAAFVEMPDVPRAMPVTTRPPILMLSQYRTPMAPRTFRGASSARVVGITANCIPR